jgi:hypothetical protein
MVSTNTYNLDEESIRVINEVCGDGFKKSDLVKCGSAAKVKHQMAFIISSMYGDSVMCKDPNKRWYSVSTVFEKTIFGAPTASPVLKVLQERKIIKKVRNYCRATKQCSKFVLVNRRKKDFKERPLDIFPITKAIRQLPIQRYAEHMRGLKLKKMEMSVQNGDAVSMKDVEKVEGKLEKPANAAIYSEKSGNLNTEEFLARIVLDRFKSISNDKYNANKIALDNFIRGDHFVTQGAKSGRIYSSFTNLSKEIRPFVYRDDRNLWEVDIKCSQPLLLATVYDLDYEELTEDAAKTKAERQKYLDMVWEDIYETICSEGLVDRGKMKERFFRFIFGKEAHYNRCLKKRMTEEFPILMSAVKRMKRYTYQSLAIFLQRKESKAVVEGVLVDMWDRDKFALSIHDSIVCHKEDVEFAAERLRYHFAREGLVPTLNIRQMTSPELNLPD